MDGGGEGEGGPRWFTVRTTSCFTKTPQATLVLFVGLFCCCCVCCCFLLLFLLIVVAVAVTVVDFVVWCVFCFLFVFVLGGRGLCCFCCFVLSHSILQYKYHKYI